MALDKSLTDDLIACILNSEPLKNKECVTLATQGMVDYFAASLQARHHSELRKLHEWIEQEGGNPCAWLVGQASYATARQAAVFNGFQAHLLDYDDVHAEVRGHPSAVILSALFASLADGDVTGPRFLSAYIVGIEVMAHLGAAVGNQHYQKGWHNTATLGGIAATAAVCYLHRYPFIHDALTIATTQASGLRLVFGTVIKPLHAGMAAQITIQACQWASVGLKAPCDIFDQKTGFLAVYGEADRTLDLTTWGNPWRIVSPGLWFKHYPFCSAAAYVADATTALVHQHRIALDDVAQITLVFSPQSDAALIHQHVITHEQGRFSAEYIVASLLLKRTITFDTFNDQPIDDQLQQLMAKMTRQYDNAATRRYAQVNILLNNRQLLSVKVDTPKGSPTNPYSDDELKHKFMNAVGNNTHAQLAYDLLLALQHDQSVNHFIHQINQLLSS